MLGGGERKTSRANVTDRLEPRLRLSSVESAGFAQISQLAAMFKCFLSKFFVHLVRQIELQIHSNHGKSMAETKKIDIQSYNP